MTHDDDLCRLDAIAAVRRLHTRELGALEYIDALLRRVESRGDLHALIHVDPEQVRASARAADSLAAAKRGPLHGLPLIVKDNIDVGGVACTAGSPVLAGHVPRNDAACVAQLRAAGALVLAKANLHEFALGVTSRNAAYGAVRNPHSLERSAGGSSGGTAAAIAAEMAPVGLGTDTGGSIRIPAAHCGIVGFRPTTGRWPGAGVVPISAPTRDTAAPMARSVADCALLDAVVSGAPQPLAAPRPRGLRLGVASVFWRELDDALAAQAQTALAALSAAGVELVECTLEIDLDDCAAVGLTIAMAENLPALRGYFDSHSLRFDARRIVQDVASPDVRAVFEHLLGAGAPKAIDYARALEAVRQRLRPAYERCFAQHRLDALVLPTTPLPPGLIDEDDSVSIGGRRWPTFASYTRHAGPASIIGLPSISLPMGTVLLDGRALPVGLQLDAPAGADRTLLALAAAVAPLLPATPTPP